MSVVHPKKLHISGEKWREIESALMGPEHTILKLEHIHWNVLTDAPAILEENGQTCIMDSMHIDQLCTGKFT